MAFKIIVCAVLAYFLGTIQTAIILSNAVPKQDIRNFGSGNAGSTNMIRTFGWGMGSLTFIGDLAKGALTTLICSWIGGDWCMFAGGIACIVGHVWPIQYGFRGGKGVAATFGVMLAVNPLVALITFAACLIVALITRFVSIASLLGVVAFFVASLFMGRLAIVLLFLALMLLVFFTHRENIARLINGTENPFFGKARGDLDGGRGKPRSAGRNLK